MASSIVTRLIIPMILMSQARCYPCRYGDGSMRLTVEQDVLFPNVPEDKLEAMQQEPVFQRFVFPLHSCT